MTMFGYNVLGFGAGGEAGEAVLLTDLIGYWRCENSSGNLIDAYTNSLDLTDQATVTGATGKVGNARLFTAANSEYFHRTSEALLQTGDIDYTFQAWVYINSVAAAADAILSKTKAANREHILDVLQSSSKVRLILYNGVDTVRVSQTHSTVLSTATWYHILWGHSAASNESFIVVNDSAETAATSGATGAGTGSRFMVGGRDDVPGSFTWNGRIDEVAFWKADMRAYSTWLYNGGTGRTWTEVQAYTG